MTDHNATVRYPGPGCVVEFMHGNKPILAWVLEEQSGRLRLLTINKREVKLATNRDRKSVV
jgi:exoribonuclease-2